ALSFQSVLAEQLPDLCTPPPPCEANAAGANATPEPMMPRATTPAMPFLRVMFMGVPLRGVVGAESICALRYQSPSDGRLKTTRVVRFPSSGAEFRTTRTRTHHSRRGKGDARGPGALRLSRASRLRPGRRGRMPRRAPAGVRGGRCGWRT